MFPQTEKIIIVEGLVKFYGNFCAIHRLTFDVYKGEILGILGHNGAGKSTLLEILETLNNKTSGKIIIDGKNLDTQSFEIRKVIGVQLQSNGYYNNLNLIELLNLFSGLYQIKINTSEILKKVDLVDKAKSKYKTLSGGQKQRFAIANALINRPKIIFLDEPTTGLDPLARRNMWQLIQEMQKNNITVILTTHYMEEAEFLCNRIGILNSGQLVAMDTPQNLIAQLLQNGFTKKNIVQQANLEDVYMSLTGKSLIVD